MAGVDHAGEREAGPFQRADGVLGETDAFVSFEDRREVAAVSSGDDAVALAQNGGDVGNLEAIKKYNALTLDADGRITFFEEKPANPTSTLTGIALYFYPRHILPLIGQYLAEGNNPDQPGRLVQWLYPRVPFYTWRVPGCWFDVGCHETLAKANRIFAG